MFRTLIVLMWLLSMQGLQGQAIRLSCEYQTGMAGVDTLYISLQSTDTLPFALRAVNFSVAFRDTCATITGGFSTFRNLWSPFFEDQRVLSGLNLSYNNQSFNSRFSYGNSDAGIGGEKKFMVPSSRQAPQRVLALLLSGRCRSQFHIENETENPINQLGDTTFDAVPYAVTQCVPVLSGISESASPLLSIWPNPAKQIVRLSFSVPSSGLYRYRLYDLTGRQWRSGQEMLSSENRNELEISLAGLAQGLYLVEIFSENSPGYRALRLLEKQ